MYIPTESTEEVLGRLYYVWCGAQGSIFFSSASLVLAQLQSRSPGTRASSASEPSRRAGMNARSATIRA
jgi:hypothetical protein